MKKNITSDYLFAEGVGVGQARLGGGDEHVSVVSAARPVGGRLHGHSGVGEDVGDGAGQAGGVRAVVDVDFIEWLKTQNTS